VSAVSDYPWFVLPEPCAAGASVVVIGGGLAGTSVCYALAGRGFAVTLVERHEAVGQEASGNPVGVAAPLITMERDSIGKLYATGFRCSLEQVRGFLKDGHELYYDACGALSLRDRNVYRDVNSLSFPVEHLWADAVSDVAGVSIDGRALYVREVFCVSPPELCRLYMELAGDKVERLFCCDVLRLERSGDEWEVVVKDTGAVIAGADIVVIANAKDAGEFEQCEHLPLGVVRGQLTFLDEGESSFADLRSVLLYDGGYVTPVHEGRHCFGATYDRGDLCEDLRVADAEKNLAALGRYVDVEGIDAGSLEGRVAFRTVLPDRRAVVGAMPDVDAYRSDYADLVHGKRKKYADASYLRGLYISVGHGARGLTSCPLAAEHLAGLIAGEMVVDKVIADLWHPGRFVISGMKRKKGPIW